MISQNNDLFIQIKDCKDLRELYENKDNIGNASVVLINADNMADDVCSEAAEWLSDAPFITVFAAENIKRFSYEMLSLFDIRLGGEEYPAAKAKADDKYRLLCGSAAYYALLSGTSETALNFVTVLTSYEGFDSAVESYIEKICKDKTASQLRVLISCLVSARKCGIESVLSAESEGFYELMSQKTEDKADE